MKRKRNKNKIINYYKDYDLIRLIALIAVLFYHLNILKGGYLAVCIFFVLSGYLSYISATKKEKFSLKKYYVDKLKKIYLPLIIVVFITIFITTLNSNIVWFNLKPETTSVLFFYNNFWQLSANLDYFARHINSPFMHLWYISILIQFDLVFPYIYIGLKKLEKKFNKKYIVSGVFGLTVISTIYFLVMSFTQNIMVVYYNTFTRIFSLLFGLTLGIFHTYYGEILPKILKQKNINRKYFYSVLVFLIILFIFIDSNSCIFSICMVLVTLITCLLIDLARVNNDNKLSKKDKFVKEIVSYSYEIYLIQYPIIFLFQYIKINKILSIFIMLILILVFSYLLHIILKDKVLKYQKIYNILKFIMIIICILAMIKYILSKDYTKEMNDLKEQLAYNEKMLQKDRDEYAEELKKQRDELLENLEQLSNDEEKLKEAITNLPVIGIGDSVMLGAVEELSNKFPKGYFDAKVSRSTWSANEILQELDDKNMLGEPIILHLGTNGDCSKSCKQEIMKSCGTREVFWLNTTNLDEVNDNLLDLAKEYSNLHIIDWKTLSKAYTNYFYADGIHLTSDGQKAYAEVIYQAIYNSYLDMYKNKKEEIIKEHDNIIKNRISFYGNDILINSFDDLNLTFQNDKFIVEKEFKFKNIKQQIIDSIKKDEMTKTIVFAFDESSNLSLKDYKSLIELCTEYKVYIVSLDKSLNDLNNYDNVTVLNFYKEINKNKDYLMADKIHLTAKGNKAFVDFLKNNIEEAK